jgi:hypothetical protein
MFWAAVNGLSWLAAAAAFLLFPVRSDHLSRRAAWIIGLGWVLAASAQYWIAGPWSFALQAVDLNQSMPADLYQAKWQQGMFGHAFAGGQDVLAMGLNSGQALSLERGLLLVLPVWLASALHQLLITTVCVVGAYLAARRLFRAPRAGALAVACFFSLAHEAYTHYSWTGGLGYAAMPLAAYLIVGRQERRWYWSGVAAFAAVHALSMTITHSFIALAPAVGFASLLAGRRTWPRTLAAIAILTVVALANWHESLFAKVMLAPWSFRGSVDVARPFWEAVASLTGRLSGATLLAVLACLFALWHDRRRAVLVAVAAASLLLGPLLLAVPWAALGLAPLKGFNFLYASDGIVAVAVFVAAAAMAGRPSSRLPVRLVAAMAVYHLVWFKAVDLPTWLAEGGITAMSGGMAAVDSVRDSLGEDRSVVVPYRLPENLLPAAGRDSFDGKFNVVPRPYATYWQKGILAPVQSRTGHGVSVADGEITLEMAGLDYKCCESYRFAQMADADLLRIANVGTVLSALPLTGPELEKVAGSDAVPTRNTLPAGRRIAGYVHDLTAPLPLKVYRLAPPLPRVFAAARLEVVPPGLSDEEFLAVVRREALAGAAVVRAEDVGTLVPPPGLAAVSNYRQVCDGMVAELAEGGPGGLVVFNINPTPFWTAAVDGRPAPVVPANMIHMTVPVPAGARRVELRYERPLLRQKLAAALGLPAAAWGLCPVRVP